MRNTDISQLTSVTCVGCVDRGNSGGFRHMEQRELGYCGDEGRLPGERDGTTENH